MTKSSAAMILKRVLVGTNQSERPAVEIRCETLHWNIRPVLLISAVAVVALLPVVVFGIPNGADLFNHYRFALPFYDSLRSGVFYPGWLAESNNGLGDPRFRFYPPGLYYVLAATRTLFGDWYAGSIACFVLLSVLAGLGLYFWARTFFEPKLAMWAGIFFTIAPYRLNQIYQASLLSEYAACSVLPFAFAFVERICRRKKAYDIAGLAVSYALLLLTHLPLAVIGSLSLAGYAILRLERKNLAPTLMRLAFGVFLGLGASAFFWTTMLAELPWIKGNSSQPKSYYDYRLNFVFSPSALTNRNTWYANLLTLALLGFFLPATVLVSRFLKKEWRGLFAVAILFIVTLLMSTPMSRPIWAIVPKLAEVQFPWRWLSITSMAGSLLLAASIPSWRERISHWRPRDLAVVLVFVLSLGFTFNEVIRESEYLPRDRFQPLLHEIRGAVSFKDWLPIWASELLQVDKMNGQVEASTRPVTITAWQPERRLFHIAAGPSSVARVRTYYYPHWLATEGGRSLNTSAAADGTLSVTVPDRAVDVEVVFREPGRVRVAAFVSAIAALAILALAILGWSRPRTSSAVEGESKSAKLFVSPI
jgi:hypothetical protein